MRLWPIFVLIVIACSLIVSFTIAAFVGAFDPRAISLGIVKIYPPLSLPTLYPPWFVELHLAVFWFTAVFGSLKHRFCDITKPDSMLWKLAPKVPYWVNAHIVLTLILRAVFNQGLIVSYIGGWFAAVYVPIKIAIYRYPRTQKKLESIQISAQQAKEIALKNEAVQAFLAHFPAARFYVFDHAVKNQVGTCVFLQRKRRRERDGLLEDITLEVSIDLDRCETLRGKEIISHYIFLTNGEASSVVELPPLKIEALDEWDAPLDSFTLDKLDTAFDRYPSLRDAPLPVASRKAVYETA
ncbi:MAG: hypothetical protein AB1656_14580 [Candidatus Omnitrophota bacterium]